MHSPLTRPSLFPKYAPEADGAPLPNGEHIAKWIAAWAKRILTVATVVGIAAGGCTAVGFRMVSPKSSADSVSAAVRDLRDSVEAHGRRLDKVEHLLHANTYMTCAVLSVVQPKAIPEQTCAENPKPSIVP